MLLNSNKCQLLFLVIICMAFRAFPQAIDNTSSFRDINSNKYFRIHYENDFFTATDYYYTQGINVEYIHPSIGHFFLEKILLRFRGDSPKYGISIEQDAYTPTSIQHNNILFGDRPFAATLFVKTFVISVDSVNNQRLATSLSTGVIGPAAGGEQMQSSIHHIFPHNIRPLGWQNQIHNDLVLNYEVDHEKEILYAGHFFSLNTSASIRAGTLSDKTNAGIVIEAGNDIHNIRRKIGFHIYEQPLVNLVGYDATMQGGLFDHSSPYTISARQISRTTFQNNAGIVVIMGKLYLEYFQTYLTPEFVDSRFHRWGGIRIGVAY
jgi:lipid A 3-O-deacylase